ncbi:MAG TPA: Ig-like domain-containing protein [Telluria sp.]|nr:Ig-like domain-containing protein [Telluria sp.]
MLPELKNNSFAKLARLAALGLIAATLAACGGGGGSAGSTVGVGGGGSTGAGNPAIKLVITDGTGAAVSTLSGGQSASVKATVTNSSGAIAANAIVQFTASDATLVTFTPSAASALTDASGVAVITVKPASFTASGALSITATAVVDSKTAVGTANMAVGAAPLTVGTLSFSPTPAGNLPAFSTLALNIPVTSAGQPVTTVVGLTLSSLCVGDGTATLVPGTFANGVQVATYTNNGCLRGRDVLTASVGNSTQTISVGVDPANIGTIQFIGSNLNGSSIVLKGSGGQGRSEAAQLTFRVVDQHNNPLPGVDVNFTATTTTGGLTVSPARATTDSSGNVMTMVSSGTIPTPVRVIAEATRNGVTISGLSDALTVSTGLPIQKNMSMAADHFNLEGLGYDNETSAITVLLADQYGNPVSDNTAVNFVTEGGAVGSSAQGACTTTNGGCTVQLRSQAFRPLNGRVTVLAYVQGIEDFVDSNGDGQYSCTNFVDVNGAIPPVYRPLVDTCVSGGEPFTDMGDPFLDAGRLGPTTGVVAGNTLDGSYDVANGDLPFPYNHSSYSATGNGKWGLNYIRRSLEMVYSGSDATLVRQVCAAGTPCRDWTAADGPSNVIQGTAGTNCSTQPLIFRIFDVNNNPMPFGTTVTAIDADKLSPLTFAPDKVGSTNAIGGTIHTVNIKPDTTCAPGVFSVKITTPKGTGTVYSFKSN